MKDPKYCFSLEECFHKFSGICAKDIVCNSAVFPIIRPDSNVEILHDLVYENKYFHFSLVFQNYKIDTSDNPYHLINKAIAF